MSLREEFVLLAMADSVATRELCRRFGISPTTAYKWLARYRDGGRQALADQSRRPKSSPSRTPLDLEHAVVAARQAHCGWGGRKIHHYLRHLGQQSPPAPSTITDILRRHGQLDEREAQRHRAYLRFEHDRPNALWQMDFKGPVKLSGGVCHPLTVLDDHSRFALGLRVCEDQKRRTVQPHLTAIFRQYGLPERILCDNGSPWGVDREHPHTQLTAWLIRLGVGISHGRPFHPQTQGKVERLHASLELELLRGRAFLNQDDLQGHLDHWRDCYNLQRPHESLEMNVPAVRYRPSPRPFPEVLPPVEYPPGDKVCNVLRRGHLYYRGREFFISEAFQGQPVGLRPTMSEGLLDVYYCHQRIAQIDVRRHTVIR